MLRRFLSEFLQLVGYLRWYVTILCMVLKVLIIIECKRTIILCTVQNNDVHIDQRHSSAFAIFHPYASISCLCCCSSLTALAIKDFNFIHIFRFYHISKKAWFQPNHDLILGVQQTFDAFNNTHHLLVSLTTSSSFSCPQRRNAFSNTSTASTCR